MLARQFSNYMKRGKIELRQEAGSHFGMNLF